MFAMSSTGYTKFKFLIDCPRFKSINCRYLLYDDEDPFDQLKWLVKVLEQAEKNGESVHILSHVPTGDSTCHRVWSQQYNRIINRYLHYKISFEIAKFSTRFSDTIAAEFNGHTHVNTFSLFYDSSKNTATNVAFNGASVVTFTDYNPSYKIYCTEYNSFVETAIVVVAIKLNNKFLGNLRL